MLNQQHNCAFFYHIFNEHLQDYGVLSMNRTIILFITISLGVLLSLTFLKFFRFPFFWGLSLWFTIFIINFISTGRSSTKVISFNLAVIIFIFGIFEIYFWKIESTSVSFRKSPARVAKKLVDNQYPLQTSHEILGYALERNSQKIAIRYKHDSNEVVYRVSYSSDENGLRISPKYDNNKVNIPSILFFGGSYTFGEGVNDNETMPYVTGTLTGNIYSIYNFAVHGHGPQHMLAEIEKGIVDSTVKHKPRFAIYQAIPDHVMRLTAIYPWHKTGPVYYSGSSGEIELRYAYKSSMKRLWRVVERQLKKSYLLRILIRRINNKITNNRKSNLVKDEIIAFYARVVDKSINLLVSKYPDIKFHVIFWDQEGDTCNKAILKSLHNKGITVHKISNIIQDDTSMKSTLYRIPNDGHPTALTHRIIAKYIVNEIIEFKENELYNNHMQ